jgi:hypothetical protein
MVQRQTIAILDNLDTFAEMFMMSERPHLNEYGERAAFLLDQSVEAGCVRRCILMIIR